MPEEQIIKENETKKTRKPKLAGLIIIVTVLLATIGYIIHWWQYNQSFAETDNAQIDGHIAYISSKVPGKISEVLVEDYQKVKKNQLLAEIDAADLEILKNNLKVLQEETIHSSRNAKTSVGYSSSEAISSNIKIKEAEESQNILNAEQKANIATLEEAKHNLERYSFLNGRNSVTGIEYDKAKSAYAVAKAKVDATYAQIRQDKKTIDFTKAAYNTAKEGVQKSKVLFSDVEVNQKKAEVLLAQIKQAEINLDDARLKLSYTKIYAPVDGMVGRKTVEVGQVIQPAQAMMVVIPSEEMWITANYKETQLEKIKVGQPVSIKVDAYPSYKFTGKVKSLSPATGARFSLIPPDNASGNFTKVVQKVPIRIVFDQIKDKSIHLVPGMNVITIVNISGN